MHAAVKEKGKRGKIAQYERKLTHKVLCINGPAHETEQ